MAGRWILRDKRVTVDKLTKEVQSPQGIVYDFVADSSDGSVPDLIINDMSGFLCGVDYIPDETTPPDSLDISVQQIDGIERASGTFAEAGFLEPTDGQYVPFAGGLVVSLSGNTTNSAGGKIIILVT